MTTVDDYLALIPSMNSAQPNFVAFLRALLEPIVAVINLLEVLTDKYDVDKANGQQLDVIGQWVGVSRNLEAPISGVYFALDTNGVGFDQGVWFDPYDSEDGIVMVDDDTYRTMIYMKIAANQWDGRTSSAQAILQRVLANWPNTKVFIDDGMDMTMSVNTRGTPLSPILKSIFEGGYFALRPAGVGISAVNTGAGPYFGFDNENLSIAGFNVGTWT